MCQVLDHDNFIAEKVEKVSKAVAMDFILALAIFVSGIALPVF